MEKIYDFANVIDAIRNDFNPYDVLGISSDTPSDVIESMWNKYRNRKMIPHVKRAFEMLVIPVNKWVYDRMMVYVSKKGKKDVFTHAFHVENELCNYIASLENDILYDTKKDFENMIQFGRHRLTMDDPSTGVEQLEHVARFVQNKEGFWFYSKDLKVDGSDATVDIYKRCDKYVYYIREHNWEYIIESRYLFIDFNKPTKFDGKFCRLSDVACRIKGNLLGLYTEINNMDQNILMKHYYFKNKLGNVYSDRMNMDDAELKVIDIKKIKVYKQ
ncbi:MAG: hypothetical protein K2L98_04390 [Bacilli bacterium]|nr:hypothetical protein [Bacilli bacterium]